jgi:hypothetical protein
MHGAGGWRDKLDKTPRAYIDLFGVRHAAFLIYQGPVPEQTRSILNRVSARGVTLTPQVDLSRTVDWPAAAMTTSETFSQIYEDIVTVLAPTSG